MASTGLARIQNKKKDTTVYGVKSRLQKRSSEEELFSNNIGSVHLDPSHARQTCPVLI